MRQPLSFLLVLALSAALVSDVQGQRQPPRDPGGPNPNSPGAAPPVPRNPDPGVPRDPNAPFDPNANIPRGPRAPRERFAPNSINYQNMADYFTLKSAPEIEVPPLTSREEVMQEMLRLINEKLKSQVSEALKNSVKVDDDALKPSAGAPSEENKRAGSAALARLRGLGKPPTPPDTLKASNETETDDGLGDLTLRQLVQIRSALSNAAAVTGRNGSQADGSIPTETLSLNFDKITWNYWPIGPLPDRSADGSIPTETLSLNFERMPLRTQNGSASSKPFLMPVEDVFTISGRGTSSTNGHTPFFKGYRPQFYMRTSDVSPPASAGDHWTFPARTVAPTSGALNPQKFQIISAGADRRATITGLPVVGDWDGDHSPGTRDKPTGPDSNFSWDIVANAESVLPANGIPAHTPEWANPRSASAPVLRTQYFQPLAARMVPVTRANEPAIESLQLMHEGFNPASIPAGSTWRPEVGDQVLVGFAQGDQRDVEPTGIEFPNLTFHLPAHSRAKMEELNDLSQIEQMDINAASSGRFNGKYLVTGATHQYDKVVVHGWNPEKKEELVGEAGSTHDKRHQSLYFPESMLKEISEPASGNVITPSFRREWIDGRSADSASAPHIPGTTVLSAAINGLNPDAHHRTTVDYSFGAKLRDGLGQSAQQARVKVKMPWLHDANNPDSSGNVNPVSNWHLTSAQPTKQPVSTRFTMFLKDGTPVRSLPGTFGRSFDLVADPLQTAIANVRTEQLNNKYPENMQHEIREHVGDFGRVKTQFSWARSASPAGDPFAFTTDYRPSGVSKDVGKNETITIHTNRTELVDGRAGSAGTNGSIVLSNGQHAAAMSQLFSYQLELLSEDNSTAASVGNPYVTLDYLEEISIPSAGSGSPIRPSFHREWISGSHSTDSTSAEQERPPLVHFVWGSGKFSPSSIPARSAMHAQYDMSTTIEHDDSNATEDRIFDWHKAQQLSISPDSTPRNGRMLVVSQGQFNESGYGTHFPLHIGAEVLIDHTSQNHQMPPYALPGSKNISGLKSNSTSGGGAQNDRRFWKSRSGHLMSKKLFVGGLFWDTDDGSSSTPSHRQDYFNLLRDPDNPFQASVGHSTGRAVDIKQSTDGKVLYSFDVKFEGQNVPASMPLLAQELSHVTQNRAGSHGGTNTQHTTPANPFEVKILSGSGAPVIPSEGTSSTWTRVGQLALGGSMLVPSQTKAFVHAPASNSDSAPTTGSRNGNLHLIEFTSGAIVPSTASYNVYEAWPAKWKGFALDGKGTDANQPRNHLFQRNESDLGFFKRLAARNGFLSAAPSSSRGSSPGVTEESYGNFNFLLEVSGVDSSFQPGSFDVKIEGKNAPRSSTDDHTSMWMRATQGHTTGGIVLPGQKTIIGGFKSVSGMNSTSDQKTIIGGFKSMSGMDSETEIVELGTGGYPALPRLGRDSEKGDDPPAEPFPTVDGIRIPEPAVTHEPPPAGPAGVPIPYPNFGSVNNGVKDGDPDRPIITGAVPNAESAQHNFYHAWPSKWSVPAVDSSGSNARSSRWIRMAQPYSGGGYGQHAGGGYGQPIVTGRLYNGESGGIRPGKWSHTDHNFKTPSQHSASSPFDVLTNHFGGESASGYSPDFRGGVSLGVGDIND